MTIGTILRATIPALALAFTMSAAGTAQAATKKAPDSKAKTHHVAHAAALPGYKTLGAAKAACHGTVVWHATGSKVFHGEKSKYFGKTKRGAYVCEKVALEHHLHASKY
ncbi:MULTISPECIES: hypothetical protein [Acidiphilium]|jgi:hypothetical protein|uniref:Uncharacterized protein n=3 Tax=Acidiphilium TaxID=522 RepID=A5G004_ACICJ|nr:MULTISPECIES: hypothetical protein [Acidiphilium]MBU6355934.1 hypothetical protein [Rhodospirillales bacterium]ABQ31186.1 hypothetical protein Acry_1985 [Acidiphilium cryptum JF-5]EGO96345.1 hypothetical protein APM_0795 [Acidiphilium sp. PM]KDM68089.1 hypothetical protein ACIDI_15c00050 [Acidiphilium sp. JA12-A1]UNC13571.1 hypothetical protein FE249_04620 [Acidiphilium multivorum]